MGQIRAGLVEEAPSSTHLLNFLFLLLFTRNSCIKKIFERKRVTENSKEEQKTHKRKRKHTRGTGNKQEEKKIQDEQET